MKTLVSLLLVQFFLFTTAGAQSGVTPRDAARNVQQTQTPASSSAQQQPDKTASQSPNAGSQQVKESSGPNQAEIKIPAGTKLDVEVAYTVTSFDVRPGDLLSFRVLVPIIIDGVTVVEKGALVTGRVLLAKRGGHWGKAGRLSWNMQDVIAVDATRVPLQSGAEAGSDLRDVKSDPKQSSLTRNSVKGTSHGGEVATKMIIAGAIFPPLAPLGLIQGFRRGENAVLPEGKRFIVFVQSDASVNAARDRTPE